MWCVVQAKGLRVSAAGSRAVADLALRVRPRYHFAGGLGVHFARPPYLNKDLGTGAAPGLRLCVRTPAQGLIGLSLCMN